MLLLRIALAACAAVSVVLALGSHADTAQKNPLATMTTHP